MKRLDLGNLPPESMGKEARWRWANDQFKRIALASRRDDKNATLAALATKAATIYATATYDPSNKVPGGIGSIHIMNVPGAALGMRAEVSFSLDLQGIVANAWVSAANVVSVQFYNPTAGAIDLGSGRLRARVWTDTT